MSAQLALANVVQGRPQRVPGRKRGARPKPAPSFTDHECVLLSIDPGATSGWAVFVRGGLVVNGPRGARYGVARTPEERRIAVREGLLLAESTQLPLLVVAEKWSAGGKMGHAQIAGLNAQWGRWADVLEELAPRARVVRVYPQTWRPFAWGKGHGPQPQWKRIAVAMVKARFRVEVEHDVADAIGIGVWGSRAGEVAEKMPKRRGAA